MANPCGLIAKTFFNDTFSFVEDITIEEDDIAWKSDRDYKF